MLDFRLKTKLATEHSSVAIFCRLAILSLFLNKIKRTEGIMPLVLP